MGRPEHPITLGVRFLREQAIDFLPHLYRYQGGGAAGSAEALGISPFGQRTPSPTYLQLDLFEFETILVNGGQRGFLVEVAPGDLEQALAAEIVDVAVRPR